MLVVEDDLDNQSAMVDALEFEGIEVLVASNGEQALQYLRMQASRVCLVLLDLIMPGMDGETFLIAKGDDPNLAGVPVVVMSAHQPSLQSALQRLGTVEFLSKPFNISDLLTMVKRHCQAAPPHLEESRTPCARA